MIGGGWTLHTHSGMVVCRHHNCLLLRIHTARLLHMVDVRGKPDFFYLLHEVGGGGKHHKNWSKLLVADYELGVQMLDGCSWSLHYCIFAQMGFSHGCLSKKFLKVKIISMH